MEKRTQATKRISRQNLFFVGDRPEQGGGFMAGGYARVSGGLGVVLANSGPGATNLVTALADAPADSGPRFGDGLSHGASGKSEPPDDSGSSGRKGAARFSRRPFRLHSLYSLHYNFRICSLEE